MSERPIYLPQLSVARPPDFIPHRLSSNPEVAEADAAALSPRPSPTPDTPSTPSRPTGRRTRRQESTEQAPRVSLAGRVATETFLRTTPKGQPVGGFKLAVHDAQDRTTYYTVLGFGDRAAKLHGAVQIGQLVQVTGYLHIREVRGDKGKVRVERSIYAVAWRGSD